MPISQQQFRNNIGNYQINNSKDKLTTAATQKVLNALAKYPGNMAKRTDAELWLHLLVMTSNISLAISKEHMAPPTDKSRERRSLINAVTTQGALITSDSPLGSGYHDAGITHGANQSLPLQPRHHVNPGTHKFLSRGGHPVSLLPQPTAKNESSVNQTDSRDATDCLLTPCPIQWPEEQNEFNQKSPEDQPTENVKRVLTGHTDGIHPNKGTLVAVVEGAIEHIIHYPGGVAEIFRALIEHSGEYGSHTNETLTPNQQFSIVKDWLSAQAFENNPGEFVGRILSQAISENKCRGGPPLRLPVDTLYATIINNIAINSLNLSLTSNDRPSLNKIARNYIYHEVILKEFPFLELDHAMINENNIYIGSVDWGFLHAGLKFAHYAKINGLQFSVDELMQIGSSLEGMLREGVVEPALIQLFELPAKLYYINYHAERGTGIPLETIFRSEEGNKAALDAFFAAIDLQKKEENPYYQFKLAWDNYHTRTQIREGLLNTTQIAAEDKLTSSPFCLSKSQPEKFTSDDADRLFLEQNENIATKYAAMDTLRVALAFEKSAAADIDFLRSARIYPVSAIFTTFHSIRRHMAARVIPRHAYTVHLAPTVDLFIALKGDSKRIYAMQYLDDNYTLRRVDYEEDDYRPLMADREKIYSDRDYKLKVNDDISNASLLKNAHEPLEQLVGQLIKKHRKDFINNLHELGYEETTGEKAQRFLLSLIPLYNCINDIKEEKNEAALSCTIDMFVLLPLAGQGLGLSARFAQQGLRGGILAFRTAMGSLAARESLKIALRRGTLQIARSGILPAAEELNRKALIQLGLTALRSADPGVELMGRLGIGGVRQITAAARVLEEMLPAWKKILPSLDNILSRREVSASIGKTKTGRLPGFDEEIPIRKLGGDRYNHQPIYVRVNPLTEELSGKKYTLSASGILHAVPKPMAQRLKNILATGFSGRGAAKYAKQLAEGGDMSSAVQSATPVTAYHLLRWLDLNIVFNPAQKEIFLKQFGLSESVWSTYMSPSNVLTARAQRLLALAEMNDFDYLFTLTQAAKNKIILQLDVRSLQRLLFIIGQRADAPAGLSHIWARADERLAALRESHSIAWRRWSQEAPPQTRRWLACEILNEYFNQDYHYLSLAGFDLKKTPPFLPDDILHLDLSSNGLDVMDTPLPNSLEWLHLGDNNLGYLPHLPNTLVSLDASLNSLMSLPELKSLALTHLNLRGNKLHYLPRLPSTLVFLDVSLNKLKHLPTPMPQFLECLIVNNNDLILLTELMSDNLKWLSASHNNLLRLPHSLSSKIEYIDVSYNRIRILPLLSKELVYLDVSHNFLQAVPMLPPKLEKLFASHNLMKEWLSILPPYLNQLQISSNSLTSIPHDSGFNLKTLWANNNQLTTMPKLPSGLNSLSLNYNLITGPIEDLPYSLRTFHITNNKITRLPQTFPPELKEIDVTHTRVPGRPAHLPESVRFIQGRKRPRQ